MVKELKFIPEWDGRVEAWTKKYISRHLWRIPTYYDFEDLLQDCKVKFIICQQRYSHTSIPQQFWALYKSCVCNHITDLAIQRSSHTKFVKHSQHTSDDAVDSTAELNVMIGSASIYAQKALQIFETLPGKRVRVIRRYLQIKNRGNGSFPRPTTLNDVLCFLVKIDPKKVNLETILAETLRHDGR